MRWFVEVSRIGEDAEAQRYCVEAKQWQAALQEARKLRGDAGPLSKFSIELMDDGYRAVDPKLKVRYVVNKAPAGAPLTGANGAAAAPATAPMSTAPATEPMSSPAPAKKPLHPGIRVPHDPVPPPPSSSAAAPRVSANPTQRSLEAPPKAPAFQLVRKREEEPTEKTPISYREYAYAVAEGTDIRAAEALLWARFREVRLSLEGRPAGQFVQLAVFDHMFERRPLRPPLATLAWKDWRGDPVVQFPGRSAKPSAPPPGAFPAPPASAPAQPSPAATAPAAPAPAQPVPVQAAPVSAPVQPVPISAPQAAPVSAPVQPAPISAPQAAPVSAPVQPAPISAPQTAPVSAPVQPAPISAPQTAPVSAPVHPAPISAPQAAPVSAPVQPAPISAPQAAPVSAPVQPAPISAPQAAPVSAPQAAPVSAPVQPAPVSAPAAQPPTRRHKAGEDLIGELFETMHELHFMPDLVAGSEFVLRVLEKTLPCEAMLVHVFDINAQHYVVVRASAPSAAKVMMHQVPDGDALFEPVMRRMRALRIDDAAADGRLDAERWKLAGVEVHSALCGPVQLAGRYLGMVELVNPQGGGPFYESEANALDYICEQFAEFLAAHPIVLDAELILAQP